MKVKLTVTAAFLIGTFFGAWFFSLRATSNAQAQQPRITLQSLQAQIDAILSGDLVVTESRFAQEADTAVDADFAFDSTRLNGIAASQYLTKPDASAQYLSRSEAGHEYMPRLELFGTFLNASGGTMRGPLVGSGYVAVGVGASRPSSAAPGAIIYNTTTGKFEGFNGTTWVALN